MGLKSPSLKTKIPWWFIIEWIDVILFTCDWSRVNNLNAAKSCRLRTIDVMASTDQLKSCSHVCVCVNVCEFSSLRLLWLSLVWVIKGEGGEVCLSVCVCFHLCCVGVGGSRSCNVRHLSSTGFHCQHWHRLLRGRSVHCIHSSSFTGRFFFFKLVWGYLLYSKALTQFFKLIFLCLILHLISSASRSERLAFVQLCTRLRICILSPRGFQIALNQLLLAQGQMSLPHTRGFT